MGEIVSTLLVDAACREIKEDIYNKILIPGQKINVRELSERYNISATPIKQALNRLTSEGIVESIPRRGMIVKNLTARDMREYSQIREMILHYSAPFAMKRADEDPSFLKNLEENFRFHSEQSRRSMTEYYQNRHDYYVDLHALDSEFHVMMVAAVGNTKLVDYYRSISTYFKITYLYGKRPLHRIDETLKEHEMILEALKSRDLEKLRQALSIHLDNVSRDNECTS